MAVYVIRKFGKNNGNKGLVLNFNVLVLDGSYTLIGAGMAVLTFYVAQYDQEQDFDHFPSGKEAFIPLMLLVQYLLILVISLYGMIGAVRSLFFIEETSSSLLGLAAALFGAIYCWLFWYYLKKQNHTHSFVHLEMAQWRFGFFFSSGILGSFLLTELLLRSPWHFLVAYVDGVISMVITGFFIAFAVSELKKQFWN